MKNILLINRTLFNLKIYDEQSRINDLLIRYLVNRSTPTFHSIVNILCLQMYLCKYFIMVMFFAALEYICLCCFIYIPFSNILNIPIYFRNNLKTLRVLGSVGEPINPEAWLWFYNLVGNKRCSIVDTFWQTETGGHVLTGLPGASPMKPGAAVRFLFKYSYIEHCQSFC